MIAKELDPFSSTDKFLIAGRKAEEQMAFYLRRYFASSEEVYVINGFKLWVNGESAQIDHLIVHANGLIIIESKSVAEKIRITDDLQWIRVYGDNASGIRSPIIQGEMQKMIILDFAKELKSIPSIFLGDNIKILIAISDSGIIDWPKQGPIRGVHKADQICNVIMDIIRNTRINGADSKIPEESLLEWFQEVAQGKHSQIPNGNWVPLLAHFFVTCHLRAQCDLNDLESPDERLDEAWQYADAKSKREVIHAYMPAVYNAVWKATAGKIVEPFSKARIAYIRSIMPRRQSSIAINIQPRRTKVK